MGEGSYFNFDLIVEPVGGKYRARVFDSPAGQASAEFELPFSELELENFVLRMGRPRAGVRRVDSSEMEAVKQCGERLFRAVFTDDVYASFLRSRDVALEEGKGLRVRLRIDVPEFHDYPWEFLYNAHLNQFLALSRDTPVVRYLELPYPVQPLTVQPPLKILVMISSPEGFPQLNVEEEWRRLSNALAPLLRRGLVTLERLKNPTLSALQQHLRRGEYHIFHFVGHGKFSEHKQDGMLLLEDENGKGRPVSGQYLGTVLHDHRSLRMVVLNACEGARTSKEDPYAGVAQTLVLQGIPAVIAMQFEIIETAAITFAQEFYGAVADGFPVDAAVSEARKAIFATGNDVEWGTPVLYMRTPQGVIFEIPEAQRVKHAVTDEPISYVDKELEQKLEGLYTEGLAAFWVEDWDKACDRFQRILAERPDHAAAAEKLAEAKRQRRLSGLYARASEAQSAENWTAAQKTLEELLKDSPEYKDAATTLKIVRKKKQLADLYAEAKQLHTAEKWQAVMKVFSQIKSIDPEYPDTENLLPSAERELAELKRQAELNELYRRAVHAMDAGQWAEAQGLLRQVQEKEPGYLETERLLSKIEAEIRQSEEEQRRQDQINTLYEQAHGLLRSKKWRPALDKVEEIRKMDEQFEDPEKIAERARVELAREEQEAERQNELAAMYAEAVKLLKEEKYQEALDRWQEIKSIDARYPDRQRIQKTARKSLAALAKPAAKKLKISMPKSLWIGLGGIGAVVILVFGIILFGNSDNNALLAPMKVPKTTDVPQKTSTLRSATVIPTALPELPEYDNFDNASFEGTYNPGLWQIAYDGGKIYQESGNLKFTVEQTGADWLYAGLIAKDYENYKITHPISFEAKMSLNTADSGGVFMQLESVNKNSRYAIYACGIERGEDLHVKCTTSESEGVFEDIFYSEYVRASWHTFRFNVDPDKNEIHFFMDDKLIGSFTSNYPDNFSNTLYSLYLQSYVYKTGESTALVDYIRIDAPTTSGYSDPTMYDDFGNATYNGRYNTSLWESGTDAASYKITQSDGKLSIAVDSKNGAGLNMSYSRISEPTFFEAREFLDPNTTDSGSHLYILIGTDQGYSNCGIFRAGVNTQEITCWSEYYGKKVEIDTGLHEIVPGWHTLRFEVDPATMTISYIIDGKVVGAFVPQDSIPEHYNDFKQLDFGFSIALNNFGPSKEPVGYIDYVRMGAIADDPTLYDNFNDLKYDGKFDASKWAYEQRDVDGSVSQQDGVLIFTQSGINKAQILQANKYWPYKLQDSIVFEANLKVDMTRNGFVVFGIWGDVVEISCGLHSMSDWVAAHCWTPSGDPHIAVTHGTWHTVRLEINVDERKSIVSIDGIQLAEDSYTRPLKGSNIYLRIDGSVGPDRVKDTRPMVGYVDNVRIMPLEYVKP